MTNSALYWLNPKIDDSLDDIPEILHERITEIMFALIDRGCAPSQELVAAALSRLSNEPVAVGAVQTVLIAHWRSLFDELDWLDPVALQAHLDLAPVKEHPLCYYIAGMIRTLSFTQWWYGHSDERKSDKFAQCSAIRENHDDSALAEAQIETGRLIAE
ncbi:MAG: hypothetical protein V2J55_02125 [Candidatus Competibacteraceae bacterium]|jgi:hypothetical protein|nr:hypothetical protein [Candidatus Competibacteraceae bacterium]